MRRRQVPLVLAAGWVRKAEHVEGTPVAEEVGRALGVRLVGKVVLPEPVDLVGGHRSVLGPVEIARSLVRQMYSATGRQKGAKAVVTIPIRLQFHRVTLHLFEAGTVKFAGNTV